MTDFREALAALGSTSRVAKLFSVKPREVRRWRDGRTTPRGVQILLELLVVGVISVVDIEHAAARVDGDAGPGPAPTVDLDSLAAAVTPVDPSSVAGKICALPPSGACKWPLGDIDDPARFRFCRAPALAGQPYCSDHQALSVRPRIARALKLSSSRPDRRASAPEALDREDIEILTHARERHEVVLELAG
jgi:hypothetical protein